LSFRRFAYWHKRNGGGGWSVVSFCFVFLVLDSSLPPQERGWQCAVERWQKQRKKYDSCKRRQCHRRQTKRWTCAVGVWLKPYFFCAWAERGEFYFKLFISLLKFIFIIF